MERKKVGLALGGGAARGMAHIGALKVLTENEIPIDFIAGTSAGSIIGGAFASGLSVNEIIEMSRIISWYKASGVDLNIGGLLNNKPLGKFIKTSFPTTKFEELKIPFAAVATDLETGEEVILKEKGNLIEALQASSAIPGVYAPIVTNDGKKLVDGGVSSALPTEAVRKFGADIVIAVDVTADGIKYWGPTKTMVGVLLQSMMLLIKNCSQYQHQFADLVIAPEIGHIRFDELGKIDELIKLGEKATLGKIDEIKKLVFE